LNDTTKMIREKGYSLAEFLTIIDRSERWYRTHEKVNGKHHTFLLMAIKGLETRGI